MMMMTPPMPIAAAAATLLLILLSPRGAVAGSDGPAMWGLVDSLTGLPPSWKNGADPCRPRWEKVSCNSGRVVSLNLESSSLSGTLPASFNSLSSLQAIQLQKNSISGALPSLAGLSNLQSAYFDFNSFSSVPPDFLAGLTGLVNLSLNSNPLSPWSIPDDLARNAGLTNFNAVNTSLSDSIPDSFGKLSGLKVLSLSNNNLTGAIPDSLVALANLQLLDVSWNNLWGKIPSFGPGVTVKTEGNPWIGSDPPPGAATTPPGAATTPPSTPNSDPSSSGGLSPDVITPTSLPGSGDGGSSPSSRSGPSGATIGAVLAAFAMAGALCFLVWFRFRQKRRKRVQSQFLFNDPPEQLKKGAFRQSIAVGGELDTTAAAGGGEVMSLAALRAATGGFSDANILGRGGFGVVYKGKLDGVPVAVKRSEVDGGGGGVAKGREEFRAEIEVFRKVKHRHLVALLGYCVEGGERLLVYEFMPEGTLGQHLFEKERRGAAALSWRQRLTVALDVARGVEYLHRMAQERFVHRDLKPSNILLDGSLRAKVSDFGLVKLAAAGDETVMTRLAGTFGYLAPEYAILGKVTTKVDVYAYGVILMEIITGRRALDDSLPPDDTHLVPKFLRCLVDKDLFLTVVDTSLVLDGDDEVRGGVFKVAELAAHCTAREPNQRPEISHAVTVLAPLVDPWKPGGGSGGNGYDGDLYGTGDGSTLSQRLERWRLDDGTSSMELLSSRDNSPV